MIGIIDYGAGNLRSVEKAIEHLGEKAVVSNDKDQLKEADGVILPGVGAFFDASQKLKKDNMDKLILDVIDNNTPFLGICLGFQLLFETSEEGGLNKGLGIFEGNIKKIPTDLGLKVPQIGWNNLCFKNNSPLFENLGENPYVYFVHSYYAKAKNSCDVAATCNYGIDLDVAVSRGNVFGLQFHPEKSGSVGLSILNNFINICKGA